MPGVTPEEIAEAKQIDLLSYLMDREPQELIKSGPHEYRTQSHHSLVISNGMWHWINGKMGGKSALDYLIKVRGQSFVEAVKGLSGRGIIPQPVIPYKPPPAFELPEPAKYPTAVVSYLQRRGIHPDLIRYCLEKGILYQSKKYQNCVFVGCDTAGKARFACLRGTMGDFKMDMLGSDKRFNFQVSFSKEIETLCVFESPIDALSRITLDWISGQDYRSRVYLSLGGTAPRALTQYLSDHPEVKEVSLCLDSDEAGRDGTDKIKEMLTATYPALTVKDEPPEQGKDYNQLLQLAVARNGLQRQKTI